MLFHDGKEVTGVNGSGKSAAKMKDEGEWCKTSARCVTVPGCVGGWVDSHGTYGKLSLGEVLGPAIDAAENGFPIAPMSFAAVEGHRSSLPSDFLDDARRPGSIVRRPLVAQALKRIALEGSSGFYEGVVGESIVERVQSAGGDLTMNDLSGHRTLFTQPLSVKFKGVTVWEHCPNAAGLVALLALNTLNFVEDLPSTLCPRLVHAMIEALRFAFADGRAVICDPDHFDSAHVLSDDLARRRAKQITDRAAPCGPGIFAGSDTVSFQTVDSEGRAVSAVNSTYMPFGSKIVAHGFTLQNRGFNFSVDPEHPNCRAESKRPYHTILPCLVTNDDGELIATLTNMGGFMQPQGHVQHLVNLFHLNLDPQQSVDAPRFCFKQIDTDDKCMAKEVHVEAQYGEDFIQQLENMGHHVIRVDPHDAYARGNAVGKAQIITRCPKTKVLVAGSDPRADGCAIGY